MFRRVVLPPIKTPRHRYWAGRDVYCTMMAMTWPSLVFPVAGIGVECWRTKSENNQGGHQCEGTPRLQAGAGGRRHVRQLSLWGRLGLIGLGLCYPRVPHIKFVQLITIVLAALDAACGHLTWGRSWSAASLPFPEPSLQLGTHPEHEQGVNRSQ